ncbi:hypothetical protein GIB67_012934 [Kingdonia uniflora]|uniref:Uncharacterized protein n=1 Tax=Kingdonia uniflora TaxID=39325 RepID=A0A7J7NFV3_9MAGN|nr:hypothetical protein GIB67_012934 [Kingdonia uniflora]
MGVPTPSLIVVGVGPSIMAFGDVSLVVADVGPGAETSIFVPCSDPYRPLWDLNPVNKIIYSVDWLPDPRYFSFTLHIEIIVGVSDIFPRHLWAILIVNRRRYLFLISRCVILTYDDCTLMIITLPKAASDVPVTGKPFTGPHTQGLHCYSNSSLPIWSVQASRQTGMVAYCSSDGTVHHFQLRGRAVENDPIRNRPDQYLCGSLTEEDNTITVNSPLPNLPFSMKKPFNSQNPEDLALALCYNDNPSTLKNKSASKLKTNPSCSVAETQKEGSNDIYPFPSKMVALHKVRWNMNKGSERWLCYGGAAGILRCQEIPLSYF